MVKTKGLDATRKAWEGAIPRVPGSYQAGVNAATDTIEKAIAAEPLYAARVTEAVTNQSRRKALEKTSTAEWKRRAAEVGAARIGPGMTAAKDKFGKGISDVLSTIEATTISPRVADPEANVDARVKPIVRNLYAMKRR